MAINHHRLKMLRKCLIAWQVWITEMQRVKETKAEHNNKALKMASFLEAAATGKLWGNNNSGQVERGTNTKKRQPVTEDMEHEVVSIYSLI